LNQLSAEASAWYLERYLPAMDTLRIEAYAAFLAEDVEVRFNNAEPVRGKAAAVAMLSGYWKSFTAIEHEPLNIFGSDRAFVLEALNHYLRHDGRRVTTRAVAVTERNEAGLATSVRVYADASPVFAQ
jgi:ketosteroid isomerase-like protein